MSKFSELRIRLYKKIANSHFLQNFLRKYTGENPKDFFLFQKEENAKNAPKYARDTKYYLAVVAILKNEASYIKEWLDYHISMGVEHFYLYDNESTDNLKEVLEPYLCNSDTHTDSSENVPRCVTYTFCPGKHMQEKVYEDVREKHKHEIRWLAIIDLDEFICPREKVSIPEFLKDYESYPALIINWLMFDTNGHKVRPEGSVLENYTRIHNDYASFACSRSVKAIVDPIRTARCRVHNSLYLNSECGVTENYEEIQENRGVFVRSERYSINKIRINHYYTKSEDELRIKAARGTTHNLTLSFEGIFSHYDYSYSHLHDYTIWQHIDKEKSK